MDQLFKKHRLATKVKGLTLTELLVVLAIMGILILLAYPVLTPLFQKARYQEAKLNLTHLAKLQQAYFYERVTYSKEPGDIGFEQEKLELEGGKAQYRIEIIEAGKSNFKARATAINDFDGDGVYNVWEIDKEGIPIEVVKD